MRTFLSGLLTLMSLNVLAVDITVRVQNAPTSGNLIFQVYDSADAFGDFRDPIVTDTRQTNDEGLYDLAEMPDSTFALLIFADENGNGVLDRNFVGIPNEPIGISNNYRPKGPPSFDEARVIAGKDPIDITLYRVLGERGQWGLGIGALGQSSPYKGSDESVLKVIPAVTYIGKRLQWFGPSLRFGLVGSDKVRLALDVNYRLGAYDEDDSPFLEGLGNRKDTLMGGLALQFELPQGIDLGLGYQHDVLDEIGGGSARVSVSRDFQRGRVRFSPQLAVNWLSDDLSNHDFGVPDAVATADRPAYELDDTIRVNFGVQTLVEVSPNWRAIINLQAGLLDSDIKDSPIVSDDFLISGFAALIYQF